MKPSPTIFHSPRASKLKEDNYKKYHSYKKVNIAMKPLLRNLSNNNYSSRSRKQHNHYTQIKSLNALIHNTIEKPNPVNQVNLPKITAICDNYEQISNSQLNESTMKPNINLKDNSCPQNSINPLLPNIKLHRHRKTIFLKQLLELVGPKCKWDFDYRTIHQCMKIATRYDPKFEILFEEEKKNIDLDNTINVIKTSLTKTLKNHSCDTTKPKYINLDIPKYVHRKNYPMFLMKEKHNEERQVLKKIEYVESAYEKQRINHRNKNQVISKIIPIDHVKIKNEEKIILFQKDIKRELFNQVIDAKDKIKKLKGKILTILEDSLCEFKAQLNPLLTPKDEKKDTNSSDR